MGKAIAFVWWLAVTTLVVGGAIVINAVVNNSTVDTVVWVVAGVLVFVYTVFGVLFGAIGHQADKDIRSSW